MTVVINEAAFLQSVKIGGKRQFCSEGKPDQKKETFFMVYRNLYFPD